VGIITGACSCVSACTGRGCTSGGGACIGQAQPHLNDELHCEYYLKRIDLIARL
jgi:hypothetical protein